MQSTVNNPNKVVLLSDTDISLLVVKSGEDEEKKSKGPLCVNEKMVGEGHSKQLKIAFNKDGIRRTFSRYY